MPSQTGEPQWLRDLSPEDRQSYEEFRAGIGYVDDIHVSPPSPWEERLLGRPLFDTRQYLSGLPLFDMTQDERAEWNARPDRDESLPDEDRLPIDVWTKARLNANRGHRLNIDGLRCSPGSDRCPYYMARWHVVFAAIAANNKIVWSPAEIYRPMEAVRACFTQDDARKSHLLVAQSRVQMSLIESRARLKDQAAQCSKLTKAIGKTTLLHNASYKEGVTYTDVLQSLSPLQRGQYGCLLADARELSAALSERLGELEDILLKPDDKSTDPDGNIWLREFTGFMCVAWDRLIDGDAIGESRVGTGFVSAAFESLWAGSPAWAADGDWLARVRGGKLKTAHYTAIMDCRAPLSPRQDQSR